MFCKKKFQNIISSSFILTYCNFVVLLIYFRSIKEEPVDECNQFYVISSENGSAETKSLYQISPIK